VKQGYRNLFGSFVLTMVVLALVFVGQTSAQVISGDLVGTVLDKTGAAVPNANVEAVNAATGVAYPAQADAAGEYRISNLPVGVYNISAWASNFAKTTVSGFKVELNKTTTLSITLEIKGAVTSIEVSGAAVALDTTTATVSNTFESRLSQDLPAATTGSGVLNLSLLSSGVASSGGVGAGSGPSVGGQRPRNNNFTIEGVDNNSKSVTGPLVTIPNDAVEEFSVLQNQYSPEFGHSSGGQFNTIIKSGTNTIHGSGFEYFKATWAGIEPTWNGRDSVRMALAPSVLLDISAVDQATADLHEMELREIVGPGVQIRLHRQALGLRGTKLAFFGALALALESSADDLLVLEDDLAFCRNGYLRMLTFPVPADLDWVSFFGPQILVRAKVWAGLWRVPAPSFGALALKFKRESLSRIVDWSKTAVEDFTLFNSGDQALDRARQRLALRWGLHVPELVEHMGARSTQGDEMTEERTAKSWPGPSFDALTLWSRHDLFL